MARTPPKSTSSPDSERVAMRRCSQLKARYLTLGTAEPVASELTKVHAALTDLERKLVKQERPCPAILTALCDLARITPLPTLDKLRAWHGLDESYGEQAARQVLA